MELQKEATIAGGQRYAEVAGELESRIEELERANEEKDALKVVQAGSATT